MICPTCGSTIHDPRAPKRICRNCGRPIRKHDKYRCVDGMTVHRDYGETAVSQKEEERQGKLL
jgi:predicted amidophosphoribosyltransferase